MDIGLVLGFFDGVHRAHREVIKSVAEFCDKVYILTFKDSPAFYFNNKTEYILQRQDSLKKLKQLENYYQNKVFEIVEQDFSELANMTAVDYLEKLINTYHPQFIGTGFNHTFGHNKSGSPEFLKKNENKYGYKYICTNPVSDGNEVISSTLIRKLLKNGDVEKANGLLKSNFILEGNVIHGVKLGRTIGFPTANIRYPEVLVKIPFGVYKGTVSIPKNEKKYSAIINWGIKPTFNNSLTPIIEAHIFDFNQDIYGQNIKIEVLKKIRNEQKFLNTEELKKQIEKDIKECLK